MVHNPARPTEVVGTIPRCGPADVDLAVQAARQAQPGWWSAGLAGPWRWSQAAKRSLADMLT
jgi:acyl-CoA reductase-like NAD-dependent aldehyde dehydrogenase